MFRYIIMSDLTPELKNLLAQLCVANSSSSSIGNVSEEIAFVSDLVTAVGPVVAYRALAKHINDFTSAPTYGGALTTAVYPGQNYGSRNGSDILLQLGNGVMTPGQEIALCMFIRANISLPKMTEIISHAKLIAYINYNSSHTTSSAVSKPKIESSGSDFTTHLVDEREYQYDVTQFFSAQGESIYRFPNAVSSDDIVYIISMSQLYITSLATANVVISGVTTPITSLTASQSVFLKMITELAPMESVLRGPNAIISTYIKPTASLGYIATGNNNVASSGAFFTTSSNIVSPVTSPNTVFAYVTSGFITTVSSLPDTYYAPTQSVVFKINKFVASSGTIPSSFDVNGDGLIGTSEFAAYSTYELKGFGLTALQIKDLGKPLPSIVAGYAGYTPSQAIRDGWSLTAVRQAFTPLSALSVGGTAFNAKPFIMGSTSSTETSFVTLTTPDLLDDLVAMYRFLNVIGNTNAFVAAVNASTPSLPNYVAPTTVNRQWLTINKLVESVARWLYDTVTTSYSPNIIMGRMSIPVLTTILNAAVVNVGLLFTDIVAESEFAQYDTTNKVITSGLTPKYLIDTLGLTAKDALNKYSWPLSLVINTFSVDRLLEKTLPDGRVSPAGTSAITITQALLGREWASNISPIASANKSFDNIPYKSIAKYNSEVDIITAIVAYMQAVGNGLTGTSTTSTGNIGKFLSDLHLPFAVVNKLIGKPYGSGTPLPKVSAADVAGLTQYTKTQRRSVFNGLNDAVNELVAGSLDTKDFVALGWPVKDWEDYARNPNGVTITITARDVLGAFEQISLFDPDSFTITGTTTTLPTDQRAIYHTKEEREALVRLFTTAPGRPPLPPAEITSLALGPLEDLDDITL